MLFNQVVDGRKVRQFSLSTTFVEDFRGMQPAWGYNGLGFFTYKRTYARDLPDGGTEEFWQTCQRVVEGCFNIQKIHCNQMGLPWNEQKAQHSAQDMFQRMWDFKFSPPGRGLSVMGTDIVFQRGSASLQNCFRGSEELITKEYGPVPFAEVVGEHVTVLHPDQTWHPATVSCFGEQAVQRVTFAPANPTSRGEGYRLARSNHRIDVTVTPNHRWVLASGTETTCLQVGDTVRSGSARPNILSDDYKEGMRHGLIFGDGTAGYTYANGDRQFHIRLCGAKAQAWVHLFSDVHQLPSYNGDPWCCVRKTEDWKDFPKAGKSLDYMAGFIFGWVVADSADTVNDTVLLCSQHPGAAAWLKRYAASTGYVLTGQNIDYVTTTNFGPRSATMNRFTLTMRANTFWKVESVIDLEEPEFVYCATVPDVGSFVLASGIHTGNCAFVSSENIAEDFAGPFCFLMDMSMLGVGTGADTKGAGKVKIITPKVTDEPFVVADTREGWVDLIRTVLNSFVGRGSFPQTIDYSLVRGRGEPLKTFGGTASGPKPLHDLVVNITKLMLSDAFDLVLEADGHDDWATIGLTKVQWFGHDTPYRITSTQIVDIFNFIGKAVVAGGIRRTAEIMFGEPDDRAFMELKQDTAALNDRRWASNNSVFGYVGMDYTELAQSLAINGEPGLVWLDTAKKFGRLNDQADNKDWRIQGTNPCGEQGLESYELCVSSNTYIQMKNGVTKIGDLVGSSVDVWNGDSWSTVQPRVTGENRELFRVTLSDGSYLDCTSNHGWHVKPEGKRIFRRVDTKDLTLGSQVVGFDMDSPIVGMFDPLAFEIGLFVGDGYIDRPNLKGGDYAYPRVLVCGDKIKLLDLDVQGLWLKPQIIDGYADPVNRLSLHGLLGVDEAIVLNDKTKGLSPRVFGMDRASIFEFVAGWVETDGTITNKDTLTEGYRIYGTEPKMRDLQILLRRVGINHATIRKFANAGDETNFGVRNYDMWYCQIPSFECSHIPTRIKKASRFGGRTASNNAHPEGMCIDRARKQKIVSVVKLPGLHTTYCFDEPDNHMAVFGNVLTYQCNLVETYPAHHDSYEDFERTLKTAYLYAKTVTLVPTHDMRANAVMMRNRRIGASMSGIVQAVQKFGRRKFLSWCDNGYKYIQKMDRTYSDWLGVPLSVKTTTVKPSGTVSLLCGATPGIHYPHSEFYIRHVRVQNQSPLCQIARDAGFQVFPDAYADNTSVVAFPVKEKHFIKGKSSVSLWEQFVMSADMQAYWSDNLVSATVTFAKTEIPDIKTCLEAFETRLKGVSLLPLLEEDHGYIYPPYQTITEQQYLDMTVNTTEMAFTARVHDQDEKFCEGDKCMLPIRS